MTYWKNQQFKRLQEAQDFRNTQFFYSVITAMMFVSIIYLIINL